MFETRSHVAKADPELLGAGTLDVHNPSSQGPECVGREALQREERQCKGTEAEYSGRGRGWKEEGLCSSLISLEMGWEALVIWVLPPSKAVLPTMLYSSRTSLSPAEDGAQGRVCSSSVHSCA